MPGRTIAGAGGVNHDGTPATATVYGACGITGTHDPLRQTTFALQLDSGAAVANGVQVRISYDPTGPAPLRGRRHTTTSPPTR